MEKQKLILVVEDEPEKLFPALQEMRLDYELRKTGLAGAREVLRQESPYMVLVSGESNGDEVKDLLAGELEHQRTTHWVLSAEKILAEDIIEYMRRGVTDFLKQPLDRAEWENLLQRIAEHENAQAGGNGAAPHKVISFFSPKGGVGTTVAAVNVAVELAKSGGARVLLADFVLQHGNVAELLDLSSSYTLLDVLENLERLDAKLLENSVQKHRSGVFVLPHPHQPEESECFLPKEISEMLRIFRKTYHYTVLDTGHEFNAPTIACLDASDLVFVLTTPDLPSLYNAKQALQTSRKLGYPRDKVRLVLNRWQAKGGLEDDLINKSIAFPVYHRLPEDSALVLNSVNQGVPCSELSRNAPLPAALRKFAQLVAPVPEKTPVRRFKLWHYSKG